MPFETIKKQEEWLLVRDLDGEQHWIWSKLVDKRRKCAVVKVPEVNLRIGPGSTFPNDKLIPRAAKYTAFEVMNKDGKWLQVKAENNKKYWIHEKLVWRPKVITTASLRSASKQKIVRDSIDEFTDEFASREPVSLEAPVLEDIPMEE